ncbi:class I SAM-dependent methyltransferase [Natrialba swarupiae]|uniref:class I SAM-dependent methyltransferase n=1 Tax=Natrialba swarupiae TaxID=2448032 RepID=UPI001EE43F0A|nr:class I SAM-dependent methyltransferase [Natrialba swarupiae]
MTEDHPRADRESAKTGSESNSPDAGSPPNSIRDESNSSDLTPGVDGADGPVPVAGTDHEPSPLLRTVLEGRSDGRALDVATGLGRNAIALADAGWRVDAIDVSRSQLERAREHAVSRPAAVEWILADVDSYAFPEAVYDVVTISFYDARERLSSILSALAPGGFLFYEHYLESTDRTGPGDRHRFASNELLSVSTDLRVLYYAEYRVDGEPRVTLVARKPDDQ